MKLNHIDKRGHWVHVQQSQSRMHAFNTFLNFYYSQVQDDFNLASIL